MKEELKDQILADAIQQYFEAERKIIKLERENVILYVVIGIMLLIMFCMIK